jgi:hypothetical protein
MTEQIAKDFNKVVSGLILRLEKKSRNEDEIIYLDRLQKRISLGKRTLGEEVLIEEAAPIILEYAQPITACDDKFFTSMDVRKEFASKGGVISPEDEYIFSLIESVKKYYNVSSEAEKRAIFAEVNKLLLYSAKFLKETSK